MSRWQEPEVVRRVLERRHWAVVGLSTDTSRAAWDVARWLQAHGREITPVHPRAETVHGRRGHPTLAEVAGPLEVVDVFVRSDLAGDVVDQAIAAGATAVWLQLGVVDEAAAERALAAGLDVVMDTCPKIEAPRLGWSGSSG